MCSLMMDNAESMAVVQVIVTMCMQTVVQCLCMKMHKVVQDIICMHSTACRMSVYVHADCVGDMQYMI